MTKLEEMLADGTLQRVAAREDVRTQSDLARALGMTPDVYEKRKSRVIRVGRQFPSFDEIKRGAATYRDSDTSIEIPIPAETRWPSVAAFDAGGDVPVADSAGGRYTTPPLPAIPEGHRVSKLSTLVDAHTGESKLQWIKTSAQNDERQDWLDAVARVFAEPARRAEPVEPPEYADEDLLCVYAMGDPHLGLLAWERDAGANFDLKIAERNLLAAIRRLAAMAPAAAASLLLTVGDTLHVDGQHNTTTAGTRQDVDGRTLKIFDTSIRTWRSANSILLAKHRTNHNIIERGNHDELLSAIMAQSLALHYENEPRVTVDTSPEMYHWYRFGKNLIGTHHGHKAKPTDLAFVMAVDRAEDWSECPHRRIYKGHHHHQVTEDVYGVVIETLPTLAGASAWERSMGYRAGRVMYMDLIHRERGLINRFFVGIEQLRRAS